MKKYKCIVVKSQTYAKKAEKVLSQNGISSSVLHCKAGSVSGCGRCVKVEETIKLCDMFPDQDIVIVSKGNVVQAFAPVIKKRSEVFNFITLLQNHLVERRAHGKKTFWNYEGDMMDLALYLHRNHPEREDDKSIIDRI